VILYEKLRYSFFSNVCENGDAVQNLLSSRLLSRNVKIKIFKTIILLVVLYGC
jgi:hypothetical protein